MATKNSVFPVFGEAIEILVTSKASKSGMVIGVQTSPPGGGPPPHRHFREEETFMVLEGEYEFFDGDSWTKIQPGEVKVSLRGTYHAFRNAGTTTGRLMFTTNGGGLDEYFELISPLVIPRDMDRLDEISSYFGYEFKAPEPAPAG